MSRDEIGLTMPRQRPTTAWLTSCWAASPHASTSPSSISGSCRLALDGLLDRRDGGEKVTLTLRVLDGGLAAELGPLQPAATAPTSTRSPATHSRSGGSSTQVVGKLVLEEERDERVPDRTSSRPGPTDRARRMAADDKILLRRYHEDGDLTRPGRN